MLPSIAETFPMHALRNSCNKKYKQIIAVTGGNMQMTTKEMVTFFSQPPTHFISFTDTYQGSATFYDVIFKQMRELPGALSF